MSTSIVREDHTHWACAHPLRDDATVNCLAGNAMCVNICQTCHLPRAVDSEALNQDGDQIGTLVRIDGNGTEWWEYNA
ncbi:hypothetical protein QQZ08_002101 [Neonectria magnoliae]|uniref:Uncharacterized protein n=1 Tax=Neonectria magnoliae TaxID=2732573 RepID=A0ABR1IE36_9HYPO